MNTEELRGRAALVTGASRGIGEAAARELAKEGVSVLLAARSTQDIERIAAEITAAGGSAEAIACDVSRYGDVDAAVRRCRDAFGRIDIVVNNAGIIDPVARIEASDPEAWGKVIDVNVKGVYFVMRAAAPAMLEAGSGAIINISSGAAVSALEAWSHYCSSKAAVLSLTKCGHKEFGEQGIRVVGLSPGTVATDMQKTIKASGVNPVSQLEWSDHIPAEWAGRAVVFLATAGGDEFAGGDFSLRPEESRRLVGLIPAA
ncbi:MAG: SDR family oxidoreductase [Pseudomonadota bacterium]